MACDAAAGWAAGLSEIRWRGAPRAPTRARLEALAEIEQRKRRELALGGPLKRELCGLDHNADVNCVTK